MLFRTFGLLCLSLAAALQSHAAEVNVYSSRHYGGDAELFGAFTERTGIKVNLLEAKSSALIARIETEAEGSPADLLILTDAAMLGKAADAGLFQPTASQSIPAEVPETFRHPQGLWYGLGRRHRIIAYHPDRVKAEELPTYMGLTDAQWKGRIAIRSSSNIYNQSLLASIIAHHGNEQAEQWARGVVANMARKPQGNDRAQVAAVAAGEADLAVINHYYYLKMLDSSDPAQVKNAKMVKLHFPDQADGQFGAHTNVTGAGVLASAPNAEEARQLLAFLLSKEGQALFVGPSSELPIRSDAAGGDPRLPTFRADTLPVSELARHNSEAVRIFDRAGWR